MSSLVNRWFRSCATLPSDVTIVAKTLRYRASVPDGLTLWEITITPLLSQQGYSSGMWGKWHLGSADARLPANRGFDEWYGIWPSLNETGKHGAVPRQCSGVEREGSCG
jgi:arylsulfatase A-like enzyme